MSDYHRLLASSDAAARQNFSFDPRIAFATQASRAPPASAANAGEEADLLLSDPASFRGIPEGTHTDSNVAQMAPKMKEEKRYVIVDAAQRDWTVYPNPYSNMTFAFGDQALETNAIPVYTNNPTYPSFALPPSNNVTYVPVPGAANTRGFSYLDPNGIQVDLSGYNASLPKGNFIGFDSNFGVQNNAAAFGCPLTPSNVVSIRLVRAVLPQTPFVASYTDPVIVANLSAAKQQVTNTPYYTFTTYPYLLFFVNDYRGNYYAGTEPARRSFAVLTQSNRPQVQFTTNGNGPQYFDYFPWNNEALTFQSPLTSLQKLRLSLTDAQGNYFAVGQEDFLAVDSIRLATTLSGSETIKSDATLACIAPQFQTYADIRLRVGDSIIFHPATVDSIVKSDALAGNREKQEFARALSGRSFPILAVERYSNNPNTNQWVPDTTTAVSITNSEIDYFNVFFIPNFTTIDSNGNYVPVYPGAVDSNATYEILNVGNILGTSKVLPILNVTQQPVFTFELNVVTPDTSDIGGKPVF